MEYKSNKNVVYSCKYHVDKLIFCFYRWRCAFGNNQAVHRKPEERMRTLWNVRIGFGYIRQKNRKT